MLALLALPLALRYLGAERYGIWATITTTVVWLNLLDLGIASTLTNRLSQAYAHQDQAGAARANSNAIFLTVVLAALAGGVFGLAWTRLNWAGLFNVRNAAVEWDARATILVGGLLTLLALPANVANKAFGGYQELHRLNYITLGAGLCSLVGLLAGIALRVSMPVLFLMSPGCLMLGNLAGALWLVTLSKPWLRPRLELLDRTIMRGLLGSGSAFLAIQLSAIVVFSSDNLVVSHYLGPAQVTPYSVTWRLAGLSAVLQSLLFPALWPAYAEAHAKGNVGWIRRAFAMTMKATFLLNVSCAVVLALYGARLIGWWAGPAAVPAKSLLVAMGGWAVLSGLMTVESCLLAAVGRIREQAALSLVAAGVNLLLSIVLVKRVGSLGAILGTILSYVLVLAVPQTLVTAEVLGLGWGNSMWKRARRLAAVSLEAISSM